MKVLLVVPYISFVYGGTARVVRDLACALGQQSIHVDIVTTNANDGNTLDVPFEQWVIETRFRIQYFPCWHRYDLVFSLSLLKWLNQHVNDYDLVHTHTLFSPMLSRLHRLCWSRSIPYLMTPHGMLEPWALAHKSKKKAFYLQMVEKNALSKASAIQVLTHSEAKNLAAMGLKNMALLPNGIDVKALPCPFGSELFYQHFPEAKGKILILFMSRLDPKKGLDLLAKAFAKARAKFPNIHLAIAGPDSVGYSAKVKKYFADVSCLDAVTFTGMLTGELKQAALNVSSIFTLPSYSEGFSISVLEAMASGLPCIITTGCNFPEAAEAGVAQVVAIDSEAIAQALINCLSDWSSAKAVGARARKFILDNYTCDKIAVRLIAVYAAILEMRSSQ
ncbi:glycosyltransferase [Nodosilinea sp. LEGE 06152]|uniref:glycosyltransferase n=1 Tax=Nodosilinea sp. LEGE 06152 TaxID=2777966 RepID=UPI00187F3AE3|nr:glycosyltransferase [Nodosilinea sp. LEGE 06152]MBE9158401.1 glycosyltransferase [Nodosilinea sp. LEGE 06152]